MEKKNNWKAWIYLAPILLLMAVFTFYPFFKTFFDSFLENYVFYTGRATGIGLQNYANVLSSKSNPYFWKMVKNTLIIVFVSVPISVLLALLISVALNSIKPLQKFFQTIFSLPYVTNTIAIGMVFTVMFASRYNGFGSTGIINYFARIFGNEIQFITPNATYTSEMVMLISFIVWNALPFKILIFLSGLQSVNKQYYDAAKIDATPRGRLFWKITVPLLSPQIAYVVITSFIGAFKEYTSVVSLFGADYSVLNKNKAEMITIVGYIYDNTKDNSGLVAAASVLLFCVIMVFTLINLYVSKKKVHY